METKQAIEARRSIRRFQTGVLSKTLLTHLLELATKAPSGKNRQPWRFIVCQGEAKDKLLQIMKSAVAARQSEGMDTGSAEGTMQAMQTADAVVLVLNRFSRIEPDYGYYRVLTDTQSIGAAVQNLLLAAQDVGLGTLWICDIFFATHEIAHWLDRNEELVAAVAIGYADESPCARPRKELETVVEWL